MEILRGLITEKMTAAVEEIVAAVESTVAGYEQQVLSLKQELEKIKGQNRPGADGDGTTDIRSSDEQTDLENGDCSTSEKCKEKNVVEGLATMTSHGETLLKNEGSDCISANDIVLKKNEEKKPTVKNNTWSEVEEVENNELKKTQELFIRFRRILNILTPQTFQKLMKLVTELSIDTEERLKGVIDLTFEKAISEPLHAVVYANLCRFLIGLKVPATDEPGTTLNFRKLLLNRCQKEFEKDFEKVGEDNDGDETQKELEPASSPLTEEMKGTSDKARRRAVGNVKFLGEMFKLKMLTEVIMHVCIVKLLKTKNEESLECLCWLLFTIGKDLDFEKAKPRMDQYFNQMRSIINERIISSRTCSMLQDVLDLRRNNWEPLQWDQVPDDQTNKDEHWEQMKFQEALAFQKEKRGSGGGIRGGGGPGGRGGSHTPGRGAPPQDEGWNTGPISKNRFIARGGRGGGDGSPGRWARPYPSGRGASLLDEDWNFVPITKVRPVDATRLSRITKPAELCFNAELLTANKGMRESWLKDSIGGMSTKPAHTGSAMKTLHRFSGLQSSSSSASSLEPQRLPENHLPKDVDVSELGAEKSVALTPEDESEMSSLELTNHLDRLIQDQANNRSIVDWIEENVDEKQTSSDMFVRTLMTCICRAVIVENPYRVNTSAFGQRVTLLQRFLTDEQKELQALYALQALMVQMDQPPNLLRMFFDSLYDEEVIKEEAFYKWESSRDPAEQKGKGVALKSVTAFFTWIREAEEESDSG